MPPVVPDPYACKGNIVVCVALGIAMHVCDACQSYTHMRFLNARMT